MIANERGVRSLGPWGPVAVVVLVVGLVVWGPVAPLAGAHGGPVELQVVVVEPGPQSVRVEVRLVYLNDGHGVDDAAVTVAGESDGVQLTPVLLEPTGVEGTYAGVVGLPAPGTWTLRATSAEPTATQSFAVDVPPGGAAAAATTVPATTDPVASVAPAAVDRSGPGADPETDRTWIWVAAIGPLTAVVAVVVGVTVAGRRRRAASDRTD